MIRDIHEKLKDILPRQIKMNDMLGTSQFIDRVVYFKGIFINSFLPPHKYCYPGLAHKILSFPIEYWIIFFS